MIRILLLICVVAQTALARQKLQGFCEKGGESVVTNAISSTTRVQRSYPSCTVTVYAAGTTNLSTLYADNGGTAKANPFTADSNGYWFAYADNGRYDVRLSGGGLAAPITLGDHLLSDPSAPSAYEPFSFADVRNYGAVCDGATNIQAAITAAIAASKTRLYIPPDCLWKPTGDAIPANLHIMGGHWNTSRIDSSSPNTVHLSVGAYTILENIASKNRFCYESATPASTDKVCPIFKFINSKNTSETLAAWPRSTNIITGVDDVSATGDRQGLNVIQYGIGDGIFVGAYGAGAVGSRVWPIANSAVGSLYQVGANGNTGITGAKGVRIEQLATSETNYALEIVRFTGSGVLISDQHTNPTNATMQFSTGSRTSGPILSFFQNVSTYSGDMIYANMQGGSGTFNGSFLNFTKNNVSSLKIDSGGFIVFGGTNPFIGYGNGSPEGAITAVVGSHWHRTDGGAGTSFYVKESGSGNTGWVAK